MNFDPKNIIPVKPIDLIPGEWYLKKHPACGTYYLMEYKPNHVNTSKDYFIFPNLNEADQFAEWLDKLNHHTQYTLNLKHFRSERLNLPELSLPSESREDRIKRLMEELKNLGAISK